jgi:hypothetical protein
MASLLEIYALRFDTDLKNRVMAAIAKAAQDVINESDTTENHANRIIWARDSLTDAQTMAEKFMWAVVGNASIQNNGANSTDNDIQFVVNSNIDTFAR